MIKDPGVLMTIILVVAAVTVFFWRTVLKLTIATILALVLLGLLQLLQSLH